MNKPEILSPAGDFEKLRYAVTYGADAVYMAGRAFGMRASAGNFKDDEFDMALDFARKHNTKVYITANIMPHNSDFHKLQGYLEFLEEKKVDGIIVADVGIFAQVKKYAPSIPIHISTQTSITNSQAANFWHSIGAERIVLARELSLTEIAEIRANTPKELEIEAFVHGAMCMAYSGRCLISNYTTGRDANKGACAQACRWKYNVVEETRPGEYFPIEEDERGTYLFNSKDMCMIEHIPELVKSGISSFKIEGRAKTAYYTAGITNAYRRALDAYWDNPENFALPASIKEEVVKVSHRNYYTGFYFGRDAGGQFYEDTHYIRTWDIAAQFVSCDDDGNAIFSQKNRFYVGDVLELMIPGEESYKFKLEKMKNDKGEDIDVAPNPTAHIHIKFPFKVKDYSILRRERPADQEKGSK